MYDVASVALSPHEASLCMLCRLISASVGAGASPSVSVSVSVSVSEEVLTAGMQQWRDVSQMSYNHTVAPRYSLNRKYLLLLVLSTDRLSMRAWISSSTLTDQSRVWMSLLLLLFLAIRPWSQQPAQDQDTWPKELRRTNSTGTHTSTSFLSSSRPQVDLVHTPENSSATSCGTLTTFH